jgi:hypothetical protein
MRGMTKFAITGIAAVVVTGATGWALAGAASARAAADEPPSIVEDYSYPGAADILNVKLISGDGHIMLGDCAQPVVTGKGRIAIRTQEQGDPICFDVLAASGLLNLEVPAVYEIDARKSTGAGGTSAVAQVTTDDGAVNPPITLSLDHTTSVGKGIDDNNAPTTLVQLKVNAG